jgi:hypothetical protein
MDMYMHYGHGHAEWTTAMDTDMQNGHGNAELKWRCSIDIDIRVQRFLKLGSVCLLVDG